MFFSLDNFDVAPTAEHGASTLRSAAEQGVEDLLAEQWGPQSPKKSKISSLCDSIKTPGQLTQ